MMLPDQLTGIDRFPHETLQRPVSLRGAIHHLKQHTSSARYAHSTKDAPLYPQPLLPLCFMYSILIYTVEKMLKLCV